MKELEYQQKQEILRYEKAVKLKGVQKKSKVGFGSTSKVSISWRITICICIVQVSIIYF